MKHPPIFAKDEVIRRLRATVILGVSMGLPVAMIAGEQSSSGSSNQSSVRSAAQQAAFAMAEVQKASREEVQQLQEKLQKATPQERGAVLQELQAKREAALEQTIQLAAALPKPAKPSEAEIEARIARSAPAEMKAALIERQKLMAEFEASRESAKALPTGERGAAQAKWVSEHRQQMAEVQSKMEAGLEAMKEKQPARASAALNKVPEGLPEALKTRLEQRNQFIQEFEQLKERLKEATPQERSEAMSQWAAANRARMQAAVPTKEDQMETPKPKDSK